MVCARATDHMQASSMLCEKSTWRLSRLARCEREARRLPVSVGDFLLLRSPFQSVLHAIVPDVSATKRNSILLIVTQSEALETEKPNLASSVIPFHAYVTCQNGKLTQYLQCPPNRRRISTSLQKPSVLHVRHILPSSLTCNSTAGAGGIPRQVAHNEPRKIAAVKRKGKHVMLHFEDGGSTEEAFLVIITRI